MSRINGEKARAAVARRQRNKQRIKSRADRAAWVEAGKAAAAAPPPARRPVKPLPEKKVAAADEQPEGVKAAPAKKAPKAKAATAEAAGDSAVKKPKRKKTEEPA
ncbi:MAG: hypothetical protein ABI718_10270 [Acidobacteriota bacterium]